MSRLRIAALAVVSFALGACSAVPHALPARGASTAAGTTPTDPPGPVLGLAFSGGGSRAATFSAAVMRELAGIAVAGSPQPRSVLERPLYLSAVSGGSLSAAYYAANKPDCPGGMIEQGALSPCMARFFEGEYLKAMNEDWEGPLIESAIGDAIPRADAMAQDWDKALFHGFTFADLARREVAGQSPWLMLNGTSWDTGRRFVFTTLPASAFSYQFLPRVREAIAAHPRPGVDLAAVDRLFELDATRFNPMTFEEVDADPAALPLSLAVASSSSVPLLMGPVTFVTHNADGTGHVRHIGDGGMFDNQGIETLAQVVFPKVLARNAAGTPGRGLLIIVDASYPFDGDADVYRRDDNILAMLGKSPARISDIMEQRARAYQLLLWESLRTLQDPNDEVVPSARQLPIVYLRHTDAARELALSPPPACTEWTPSKVPTEAEMLLALSRIPTRFRHSACDAALLEASARIVVAANRQRIVDAMNP